MTTLSGAPEAPAPGHRATGWLGLAVALVALLLFTFRLDQEPRFPDESAFLAQSYFLDLFIEGQNDDWAWVEYHAYDLPPLPKYLIGLALKVVGERPPGRLAAGRWFEDISRPFGSDRMLLAARWPSAIAGALGCVAIFAIGCQLRDRRTGLLAASLLMLDPLYRLHARRAMADAPAEALILATIALGLWTWQRTLDGRSGWLSSLVSSILVGLLGGLAVLAKLNGGLALMVIASWAILAALLTRFSWQRRLAVFGEAALAGLVALATFILLNPHVTAHPQGAPPVWLVNPVPPDQSISERLDGLIDHRSGVSRKAQGRFPHDALESPLAKVAAVAVQGFGRFGPLGPQDHDSLKALPRYAWNLDRSALVWLPWVFAGMVWSWARGRRQLGEAQSPTAWAVLLQASVALVTVTAFIPLAWDRYFLSIQPGAILLASGVAVATFDRLHQSLGRSKKATQPSLEDAKIPG